MKDIIVIIIFLITILILLIFFMKIQICMSLERGGYLSHSNKNEELLDISNFTDSTITKTIVIIRHGEKPSPDNGMLTCQGFNRAINIANLFTTNYPPPTSIYAVKPVTDNNIITHLRPFSTIEPYAIKNNIPINIKYTYSSSDMSKLANELYSADSGYYIICWEHTNIQPLVQNILKLYKNKTPVPKWDDNDFDTIYNLSFNSKNKLVSVSFTESEGLNNMSSNCPM